MLFRHHFDYTYLKYYLVSKKQEKSVIWLINVPGMKKCYM